MLTSNVFKNKKASPPAPRTGDKQRLHKLVQVAKKMSGVRKRMKNKEIMRVARTLEENEGITFKLAARAVILAACKKPDACARGAKTTLLENVCRLKCRPSANAIEHGNSPTDA